VAVTQADIDALRAAATTVVEKATVAQLQLAFDTGARSVAAQEGQVAAMQAHNTAFSAYVAQFSAFAAQGLTPGQEGLLRLLDSFAKVRVGPQVITTGVADSVLDDIAGDSARMAQTAFAALQSKFSTA